MIDSKELRIGNLAESPTGWIGSVIELKSSFVRLYEKDDLSAYNFGSDLIDPIPITPEWLERLGFDYKEHKDILSLAIDDKTIVLAYTNPLEIELCHFYSEETTLLKHIIYVHQIQNLIFALTGQELNQKDNA